MGMINIANLKNTIRKSREQTRQALERRSARRSLSPMNALRFEHVFTAYYAVWGYGTPPLLTKKDWGMLKNFIVSLKEAGWEDEAILNLAILLVEGWPAIVGKEVQTNRGVCSITLSPQPNLKVFLSCTKDILSLLRN